jgi:hypothetical protein
MLFTVAGVLWTPRTVTEVLMKEQQQMSVQTTLESFFKPALYVKNKHNF